MSAPAKPKLLFLAHLLPWPLEGGGQIKSYHALRLLASHFDVTLLSLIRSDSERQNAAPLQSLCVGGIRTVLLPHSRWRSLRAFVRVIATGDSLLIARDNIPAMHAAVRAALVSYPFAAIHVDHLQMMSFVPPPDEPLLAGARIVLDQHNVEHRLLQTVAEIKQGMSPLLQGAARWDLPRLRRFEQSACRRADRILAVSEHDALAMTEMLGEDTMIDGGKVCVTPIGVDTEVWTPIGSTGPRSLTREPVVPHTPGPILSVGTMYWPPNIDAAQWFCAEILPLVRQTLPDARFQIVGAKPTRSVRALAAAQPGIVEVTGSVPDVRPYMAACGVFVVPLRAGSGMRVKILQAMSMGLPIVSTALGAEGITVTNGENILLADTAADFADAVVRVLTDTTLAERLGRVARAAAVLRYSADVAGESLLRAYREMGVLSPETSASAETVSP